MVFGWDYVKNYISWSVSYDKKSIEEWLGFRQPVILHDRCCDDTLGSLKLILDVLKYKDIKEKVITPTSQSELTNALSKNDLLHQNDLSYPALYVSVPDKSCRFYFLFFQ